MMAQAFEKWPRGGGGGKASQEATGEIVKAR